MTDATLSQATISQIWSVLKTRLVRERGRQGCAEWLDHAAKVAALEAAREQMRTKLSDLMEAVA